MDSEPIEKRPTTTKAFKDFKNLAIVAVLVKAGDRIRRLDRARYLKLRRRDRGRPNTNIQ